MKTDVDSPWKAVLERYFPQMVSFLFPHIASEINWDTPFEFLDKELLTIQKSAKVGRRIADKLVKVFTKHNQEAWVLIHIELQGAREKHFSNRMFEYYYKTYDKFKKPLMSLAILTDHHPRWRPFRFEQHLWGCHLILEYPIIKLLDFADKESELENSTNPIAKVFQAHLCALKTRKNSALRYEHKVSLVKKLYPLGYTVEDIRLLYAFMDSILRLPQALDKAFRDQIKHYEEETHMRYITSIERIGREEGREEGLKEGIHKGIKEGIRKGIQRGIEKGIQKGMLLTLRIQLKNKFGHISTCYLDRLNSASKAELERITQSIVTAKTIEEVFENAEQKSACL